MTHRPKKHLGQNFLKSKPALRVIIEAGALTGKDTVLEIGPGLGVLTAELLQNAGRVIAVEKDGELVEFLKEKFAREIGAGSLVLVHGDILRFQVEEQGLGSYKIVANIPYNITGAILKKFLTSKVQPERMVLMVQQEVAQRIVARDGRESILSISVKAYGRPKMVMKVPARYFSPPPRVDSAVIAINDISRQFFKKNKIGEEKFWQLVKKGFAHKRKKLASNLRGELSQNILAALGDKRAEEVALDGWLDLISRA